MKTKIHKFVQRFDQAQSGIPSIRSSSTRRDRRHRKLASKENINKILPSGRGDDLARMNLDAAVPVTASMIP